MAVYGNWASQLWVLTVISQHWVDFPLKFLLLWSFTFVFYTLSPCFHNTTNLKFILLLTSVPFDILFTKFFNCFHISYNSDHFLSPSVSCACNSAIWILTAHLISHLSWYLLYPNFLTNFWQLKSEFYQNLYRLVIWAEHCFRQSSASILWENLSGQEPELSKLCLFQQLHLSGAISKNEMISKTKWYVSCHFTMKSFI